jgi:peroxiredoxin
VIGVTAGNLEKLQQISADTDKCSGKFPVAADPGAKIAKQYDAVMTARPEYSDRTSYVIAPTGQVLHAYTQNDPTEHVAQSMGAVKAWKAKK